MNTLDAFDPELRAIIEGLFARKVFSASAIVTPGASDHPGLAYIVLDGVFRVVIPFEDGEEAIMSFQVPGNFGVTPYRVTEISGQALLEAVSNGTLLIANYSRVLQAAQTEPLLQDVIEQRVAEHNHEKSENLLALRRLSSRKRYERIIEKLGPCVDSVPLQQIANFIGITPVQLSRIRRQIASESP